MNALNKMFGKATVISLKYRQDRRDTFNDMAKANDLDYEFMDAVSPPKLIDLGIFGPNFPTWAWCGDAPIRRYCCNLSHQIALEQSTFIVEDDAHLRQDWEEDFVNSLPSMPTYDILYLGCGKNVRQRNRPDAYRCKALGPYFEKILTGWFGTYSYVVTQAGRGKMLAHMRQVLFMHVDAALQKLKLSQNANVVTYRNTLFYQFNNRKDSDITTPHRIDWSLT